MLLTQTEKLPPGAQKQRGTPTCRQELRPSWSAFVGPIVKTGEHVATKTQTPEPLLSVQFLNMKHVIIRSWQ